MTKKIVCLLLVCFILVGCEQVSANTGENIATPTENTENQIESVPAVSKPIDSTEATEETIPPLPTPVSYWNPICNEYISMFPTPEKSETFVKVPKGATVGLVDWNGSFARVVYDDQVGYVYAYCIQPAEENYFSSKLKVITPTTMYSYEQMKADMAKLKALYPQNISISTIGKTTYDRDIPIMLVGDPNAKYHVLVQAAMHGREHYTAWLSMAMIDYLLLQNNIPADVCYHVIPMSNPDGVIISQTQKLEEEQMVVYDLDLEYGYVYFNISEYARQWKANALGIDINRNFIVGWIPSDERPEPSCQKYRGSAPFSSPESQALHDYTIGRKFDVTLSLHSHGSVLYYQYGTRQPVNRLSHSLALAVQGVTGYVPTTFDNTTGAGYKDWVMEELGIPSLTVEIGSNSTPIVQQDTYNIFDRCKDMLPTVYKWITQN